MSQNGLTPKSSNNPWKLPPGIVFILILIGLGISIWNNLEVPRPQPAAKQHDVTREETSDSESTLSEPESTTSLPASKPASHDATSYKLENQTIHDLHGNIVYKGTIDLTATIDRIARRESNRHRNDGTTFQNREGHLPRKRTGYYKEYVHPTPGESGPGPQRIIIGEEGEIWYTPNHYKTFIEIKKPNS